MNEADYWLQMRHARGVGSAVARRWLSALGSAEAIVNTAPETLDKLGGRRGLGNALANYNQHRAEADRAWLSASPTHHLLTLDHPAYPAQLLEIPDPPMALYCLGDPDCLNCASIAIVGSRNPSASGRDCASAFAEALAGQGLSIVSGLALGIDSAAHRGALIANGITVAVVATGLDRVYPAEHRDLAHVIAARGCLISEYAIGTPPDSRHFPRRNRIISGLSLATLVVEAALRSGSLITARDALDQGREVFAIPGSIHSPTSRGCHQLIREGAKLVESTEHVLEEIAPQLAQIRQTLQQPRSEPPAQSAPTNAAHDDDVPSLTPLPEPEARLLRILDHHPRNVDQIAQDAGMSAAETASTLLVLHLRGLVQQLGGGRYSLSNGTLPIPPH